MSAMEYYSRDRRHPTTHLASVGLSNSHWQVESDYQGSVSDLSMDSRSIYVLSDPPAPPASLAVSHLSACTAPPVLSEETRPTVESINGRCTIPGDSSTDVTHGTHEWECVCSVQRLSASTDSNNSECGITEDWAQASCDPAMRTWDDEIEPESWALGVDEDDVHWHAARQWDLILEDFIPGVPVPRDTLLRMHGRPLDARRTPPELSHRSAREETRALPPVPHHRICLPLCSVLVSLLSIDDETLQLVEHSPACSELFPGPICPSNDGTHNAQEIHGVHALIESASQYGALRKGLAVACD